MVDTFYMYSLNAFVVIFMRGIDLVSSGGGGGSKGKGSLMSWFKKAAKKIEVRFDASDDKDHDCKIGIHVDGIAEAMEGRLGSPSGPRVDDPSAMMNTTQH